MLQTLPDGTQIVYVGGIEVTITGTQRITKTYYSAGAKLIAMRVVTGAVSALYFVHNDHLGSVSLVTDGSGAVVSEQKYTAWGVVRPSAGSGAAMPTDIGFTGQRLDSYINMVQMGARWYDPALGRFVSADSIVPNGGNPQDLNRYAYARNNPLKYTDPTGHCPAGDSGNDCRDKQAQLMEMFGVRIGGSWTEQELTWLDDALTYIRNGVGELQFVSIWDKTEINRYVGIATDAMGYAGNANNGIISIYDRFWANARTRGPEYLDIIHEMGHVMDIRLGRVGKAPSQKLQEDTGSEFGHTRCLPGDGRCKSTVKYLSRPGDPELRSPANEIEDWAQAFTSYITRNTQVGSLAVLNLIYSQEQLNVRLASVEWWFYHGGGGSNDR